MEGNHCMPTAIKSSLCEIVMRQTPVLNVY